MADRLTQLQEAYDQLLLQMFASMKYINTKHPHAPITGYSVQPPTSTSTTSTEEPSSTSTSTEERPASPTTFTRTLHELAQDLVVKQAQIDYLMHSIEMRSPGTSDSTQSPWTGSGGFARVPISPTNSPVSTPVS